ncbi:hypothetical protein CNMCM7691_006697 [Aspergillus felis]|uniref:Major facilitator superfamily (MFS) profile domain-containing protein n=1 Tax=Aspergillus felis TaxID=1287682 RepID=A0A8H6QSN6_9EURO|nr:hypothetical protein CNMCM7691_006697 [Aspergillus felis]
MVANTVVATSGEDAHASLANNTHDQWIKDPGLRRLNLGVGLMFTSAAANGYDGSLMNGLLALPLFLEDLSDINSNIEGLIIAAVSLGGTPSFIPASYFADAFGRKKCVALGSAIMSLHAGLVSKGRRDEALEILARYHANGDHTDELVLFEYREICEAIDHENAVADESGWAAFFSTRGAVHRLIICILVGFMIQWAGNGIVSYYLAPILKSVGVTSSSQQAGINLALQAWNGLAALGGALATEKYGRRPLWMISTALMFVFFSAVTALSGVFAEMRIKAAGSASVAMLFLFFGSYALAYTPLSIAYPVEILPYHLRAKGFSLCLTVVFGAGFFNQYVNPIAFDALAWKFYFVYVACLTSFFVIIYFLFPETKGRTLEEIAVVFDGPAAQASSGRTLGADGEKNIDTCKLQWPSKVGVEHVA